jgi:hypothetical protein
MTTVKKRGNTTWDIMNANSNNPLFILIQRTEPTEDETVSTAMESKSTNERVPREALKKTRALWKKTLNIFPLQR